MTFDALTQEALKLPRPEMFAMTQLLLQALQAQESAALTETPEWLKQELRARAADIDNGQTSALDGWEAHQDIIREIPASSPR